MSAQCITPYLDTIRSTLNLLLDSILWITLHNGLSWVMPLWNRLVPWLAVLQLVTIFCFESFVLIVCTYGIRGILVCSFFHGLSIAITLDCLQNFIFRILFPVKHTLTIACNHLIVFGPICFGCSTSTSSLPAALLFWLMGHCGSTFLNRWEYR